LFSAFYGELHRVARRELARAGSPVTLRATEVLHEAYLDLAAREAASFPDRNRFMAYAARVMRGVIIDYAQNRQAQKRGGRFELTSVGADIVEPTASAGHLSRLSDALDELAAAEPPLAQVVDLKFFCGFSFTEIAAMQRVSERTVQRNWRKARMFLHHALGGDGHGAP
jgi:RNA polymerase sigma factor (TIGR02999 family)